MTLKIQPLRGKVFVKPEVALPAETFLHIPESAKNRDMPDKGIVFAMSGRRISKSGTPIDYKFKVGDRVFFPKFTGIWAEIRGHKFIVVNEKDIAAILE